MALSPRLKVNNYKFTALYITNMITLKGYAREKAWSNDRMTSIKYVSMTSRPYVLQVHLWYKL